MADRRKLQKKVQTLCDAFNSALQASLIDGGLGCETPDFSPLVAIIDRLAGGGQPALDIIK